MTEIRYKAKLNQIWIPTGMNSEVYIQEGS